MCVRDRANLPERFSKDHHSSRADFRQSLAEWAGPGIFGRLTEGSVEAFTRAPFGGGPKVERIESSVPGSPMALSWPFRFQSCVRAIWSVGWPAAALSSMVEDYLVRWVEQERLLLLKLGEAMRAVMQDRRALPFPPVGSAEL